MMFTTNHTEMPDYGATRTVAPSRAAAVQTWRAASHSVYAPPTFTSRDPHFERYFWTTPYGYCNNNPLKYVDPTGMDFNPDVNHENMTITIKATYCTTKEDQDRLAEALDVWNNQSGKYTYTMGKGKNVKTYTINFDLTMKVFDNDDALAEGAEQGQNFFNGRAGKCDGCWAESDGANISALPEASTRSIAHEIGHTLGIADHVDNIGLMLSGGKDANITQRDIATILDVSGICWKGIHILHANGAKPPKTYSLKGQLGIKE